MKKKIGVVCFLIIFVVCLAFLQKLVMPKYMEGVTEGAFIAEYYEDESRHEVLFLGDCEAYENFNPVVLWEEFGINSYIRGSSQQLMWQSYYLLRDTLRYETPSVVVLNVLALKYDTPQSEAYNRMTLDGMKWSLDKVRAINVSMTEGENFAEYLFPILRFHERIFSLSEADFKYLFKKDKVSYNGYYLRCDVKAAKDVPGGREEECVPFGDNALFYLEAILELCRMKDIDVILVKAPSLYPYWYQGWEQTVQEYADKYNVKYINYLELQEEVGLDFETDTYDGGLHLNLYGGEKVTKHLGEILSSEYSIADRRNETGLAESWKVTIERYEKEIEKQLSEGVKTETTDNSGLLNEKLDIKPKTEGYIFVHGGVQVIIDADAEPITAALGTPKGYFEAPSCAFTGISKIYDYGSFKLETYPYDGHDYISYISFNDDLVETAEGVYIGCSREEAVGLLGTADAEQNGAEVYRKGDMQLLIYYDETGCVNYINYKSNLLE